MKCSECALRINHDALVVTLVSGTSSYTAVLHLECVRAIVGDANMRKLRNKAFSSGWTQRNLPDPAGA
jgi:hypothetical protein